MNKIKYFFILLIAASALVSCNKDDDEFETVPLRDYAEQYKVDQDSIEKYLKSNYISVNPVTFDAVIAKLPPKGTQKSIWEQTDYPLQSREVYKDGITYKIYYLVLNEGGGENPCNYDNITTSYVGHLLDGNEFDNSYNLGRSFNLGPSVRAVIDGFSEILPKFKTGISTSNSDGTKTYSDYGAGVMFLPSGMGYYGSAQVGIPVYSPLVFKFRLYELTRLDHDGDGVMDFQEDTNGDGYLYDFRSTTLYPNPPAGLMDDTDGDGIPDFLDIDDDGDGYPTRSEITKAENEYGVVNGFNFGPSRYFPFNAFEVADDPSTPAIDESLNSEPRGIPAFVRTETVDGVVRNVYDYTTPGRLKIHLDKAHNTTKVTTP
jgi:FKBP-type peptidyl-prolyl cis-trans isomerase FkpA